MLFYSNFFTLFFFGGGGGRGKEGEREERERVHDSIDEKSSRDTDATPCLS